MNIWSYPKIHNVGGRFTENLFKNPVVVEEKIDGSQVGFCKRDGELHFRSKGQVQNIDAPDKLFVEGVEAIKRLDLQDGWVYRAEYLKKPKHNVLCYDRIPNNHVILFDIETADQSYLTYEQKKEEAARLGLEVVPRLFEGEVRGVEHFRSFMDTVSCLGGQKIEGVVIKNYCVSPEHKTLTKDLEWVNIGDLKDGDDLLACTEESHVHGQGRRFCSSRVLHKKSSIADVFDIELSNGKILRATANHPWLVYHKSKGMYRWKETSELKPFHTFKQFLPVWGNNNSYEAGYLSGIVDGEGTLYRWKNRINQLSFSQNPGAVLTEAKNLLDLLEFTYSESGGGNSPSTKIYISGGKREILRFIGSIRPKRFLTNLDLNALGEIKSKFNEGLLQVSSIKYVGKREIVELQTTSKTYFVDGFVSHNSQFGPDGKVLMGKHVSEAFKEVHRVAWKQANPGPGDIRDRLVAMYKTPARWNKSIIHASEDGSLTNSPKDIGPLIKRIQEDIKEECTEGIKEVLYKWAIGHIMRGCVAGFPETYKNRLVEKQFSDEELQQ